MQFRFLATVSCAALLAAVALPAHAQMAPSAAPAAAPQGDLITGIRIEGNQRVEAQTIRTYLGLREGSRFDAATVDQALKSLFATGFFSDVKLLRAGGDLVVRVVENPIVSRAVFEGNTAIETADLEKEIELKARSIYTRARVQADVKRILDIYRKSGRYSATVEPEVVQLDQNRVDLVYKITEGSVSRIRTIAFVGNNAFSTTELQGVLRTAEERWWRFLTDSDKYDPDRLQYDQELLRRYYVSQGYADFQVKSAHAELSPSKDAFFLTFVLDEGPQYTLSSVQVENNLKGKDKPDLDHLVITEAGDLYNATQIEDSIDAMTKELGNLGYAFVDISPKLERDRDRNTIALTYAIKPGPRVYVERINITGNVRTLDSVIRREFRIAEGDPYNTSRLSRTEQRLNNLGFFEKVKISTEPGSAPDKTVINVDVQEKSTGEINIGAGVSSSDGLLADFGVRERNLLGRGQELNARVTWAARRKQMEAGFTEPYFLGRDLSAGFDVFRTRLDYQTESSYDIDTKGFTLRTGYNIRERLQHLINYTYRANDITDVKPTASRYIRDQEGKSINSSVGHSLVYDDRNNRFDPSSGYYLKLSQDVAGLGGDARYLKHEVRTSYFHPWAKNWVFNIGGAAGHIFGYSDTDVRIADRFFIGGELLRGFDNLGIGPRDLATEDALGGNTYYVASVEQRFPLGLPEEVGILGAAFIDVGSLWDIDTNGPGIADSGKMRISAGVGVSWQSPFGPIRIDIARPLVKEDYDDTELFRFNFGTRF